MGIPATIEFSSSLRSSLQLLVINNKIKTTTEKSKGIKLKFNVSSKYKNQSTNRYRLQLTNISQSKKKNSKYKTGIDYNEQI